MVLDNLSVGDYIKGYGVYVGIFEDKYKIFVNDWGAFIDSREQLDNEILSLKIKGYTLPTIEQMNFIYKQFKNHIHIDKNTLYQPIYDSHDYYCNNLDMWNSSNNEIYNYNDIYPRIFKKIKYCLRGIKLV